MNRFLFFRVGIGVLFCVEHLRMIPYARELLGTESVAPTHLMPSLQGARIEAIGYLPAGFYIGLLAVGAAGGILFALGWHRRWMACLLFLCQWIVMHRIPLADNPETYLLQWALIASLLVRPREPGISRESGPFYFPQGFEQVVWVVFAGCYFFAAVMKIYEGHSSWREGTALFYLFHESPPRRLWFGDSLSLIPVWLWPILTWGALVVHSGGIFLCFKRRAREIWWWVMLAVQLTSLALLDLGSIIFGMLLVQCLCWMPWVDRQKSTS